MGENENAKTLTANLATITAQASLNNPSLIMDAPLSVLWPRVPADRPVEFTTAQFPDEQHGRCPDDAEGLLKLACVSCETCWNPYHVSIDCPHGQILMEDHFVDV